MYVSARLILAFLVASGVMVIYMSRVSLSVAIVTMVRIQNANESKVQLIPYCQRISNVSLQDQQLNLQSTHVSSNFLLLH